MRRAFRCTIVLFLAVLPLEIVKADVLRTGDVILFSRLGGEGVASLWTDDPLVRVAETAGEPVTLRLNIDDASRVITLRAGERREIRLRDEFTDEALSSSRLRVEILQGSGNVVVEATELTAESVGSHRRAVQPAKSLPTSVSLIDDAEAAGKLDSETALLYRVYALFGDARLPAQYRGDDGNVPDSVYLGEVVNRFATLSPAAQAIVQPFLVPPAYKGSWAASKAGLPGVTALDSPPPCQSTDDHWQWVDVTNYPVRVWYRTDLGDDQFARRVASEIDTKIWPKIASLMAPHAPKSDEAERCGGGNGRLDIYLTDIPRSFTGTFKGSSNTAAFITLRRTSENTELVHEIFHAFQYSFPLQDGLCSRSYKWWTEGSAQWAIDLVYPDNQYEHGSGQRFLDVPAVSLDLTNDSHEYGSYLLPFFLARKTGAADFVRTAWELCATQPALEAVDQAIGGFEKVWPDFARYNWNREPVRRYADWDSLTAAAKLTPNKLRVGLGVTVYQLDYELPHLSAVYYDIKFSSDVSFVAFWNGVTSKLSTADFGVGPVYTTAPADSAETKGGHVTAIRRAGDTWITENWTDEPWQVFCRDIATQRFDELVLIISNSDFKGRDRKLVPPGASPIVYTSNVGCNKWTGEGSFTGNGATINTSVTWTRVDGPPSPYSVSYVASGVAQWSVSMPGCTSGGSVSIVPTPMATYYSAALENPHPRRYLAAGATEGLNFCGQATGGLPWLFPPAPPTVLEVEEDGKVIDDSYSPPGTPYRYAWHFEAQREK